MPRAYAHPIYGGRSRVSVGPAFSLSAFNDLVQTIETVVREFFPIINVNAPFLGSMAAVGIVNPVLFVRLKWRESHPSAVFDKKSSLHLSEIKDYYYQIGRSWKNDPLFIDQ